ncbi:MAG: hypothetical protein IT473_03150 [Lysobacter sp.]|nr:hypothetical protein [Lysobacter sp.]
MNLKKNKTNFYALALLVCFLVCFVPAASWLLKFWSTDFSGEPAHWSAFGDFFGGTLSPILAFLSFIGLLWTIRNHEKSEKIRKIKDDDQQYFKHSTSCMERAFHVISGEDKTKLPIQDRLAWLTCARLLLSAKSAEKKISHHSKGLQEMLKGEQEHWRMVFYTFFRVNEPNSIGTNASYFRCEQNEVGFEIDERSIRVIYEFMEWPDDAADPIDAVEFYDRKELDKMGFGKSGIRKFVLSSMRFDDNSPEN